jgi:two-component system cell cycle sensor histidine kinase/response regulator CckA
MQLSSRTAPLPSPFLAESGGSQNTAALLERKPGILVVDDEECIRDVLRRALEREGYPVWLAGNGREALTLFRHHREAIAVVLLDVLMPGLDGVQTLKALRQIDPAVRSCFMSGSLGDYRVSDLLDQGATCLFSKPFRLEEVTCFLGRFVAGAA